MRQFGFAVEENYHHNIIFLSDLQSLAKMREIDIAAWVGALQHVGLCRLGYARRDEVLFHDHVPPGEKPPYEPVIVLTWNNCIHAGPILSQDNEVAP